MWAESVTTLWWAAPVSLLVGSFLVATDRFGRPEWNYGLLAIAGFAITALYVILFTDGTIPSNSLLAPLSLGAGLGMVACSLYLIVIRPTLRNWRDRRSEPS
jgi:peptidoglycan/LPS O-acetylase OafA/YrhL